MAVEVLVQPILVSNVCLWQVHIKLPQAVFPESSGADPEPTEPTSSSFQIAPAPVARRNRGR